MWLCRKSPIAFAKIVGGAAAAYIPGSAFAMIFPPIALGVRVSGGIAAVSAATEGGVSTANDYSSMKKQIAEQTENTLE